MVSPDVGPGRGEVWPRVAWVVLGLLAAWALYLGARPAGRGPIAAWSFGPALLTFAALAVGLFGVVRSFRRRPFATRRRVRALFALGAVVAAANLPFPFPSRHQGHPLRIPLEWPVEGTWTVVWGGRDPDRNLLARARPDRRFGMDLVVAQDGRLRRGQSDELTDWFSFDRLVRAPAAGRVVRIEDGHPDLSPGTRSSGAHLGNHVVLRVDREAYLFVAGLRQGSISVAEGEDVLAGTPLGRVGSSAGSPFTPWPHLALHVQDTPEPFWGQAIPFRFTGLLIGGQPAAPGIPRGGVAPDGSLIGEQVTRARPFPRPASAAEPGGG